ncbi:MAG: hypothetical protein ACEPOW_06825 [Bacteroidales bacterium]
MKKINLEQSSLNLKKEIVTNFNKTAQNERTSPFVLTLTEGITFISIGAHCIPSIPGGKK